MSSLPAVYAHLSPGHRTEQGRPTRGHQPITGKPLSASTWQDGSNGGVANKLHE